MYKNPKPTVDITIVRDREVVLIRRKNEPFKGKWVFPGGFMDYGETAEAAAKREAMEETCLDVEVIGILGVYSDPERDPRGHVVTTVFVCRPRGGELLGADDAAEAKWVDLDGLRPGDLAFDHDVIAADLKKWLEDRETFWSTKKR